VAIFESNAGAIRGVRIWHPDVVPSGLDALSYQRGDGTAGWSYPSNETGTVDEDDFGLNTGTMISDLVWKVAPSGEFSITTYIKTDADNTAFRGGGIVLGSNLTGARANATFHFWHHQIDGGSSDLHFQKIINGSLNSEPLSVNDWGRQSGAFLRLSVNSGQSSVNVWASIDGSSWLDCGTTTVDITINQIGLLVNLDRNQGVPWWRVRTGAGEFTNEYPEGGLT